MGEIDVNLPGQPVVNPTVPVQPQLPPPVSSQQDVAQPQPLGAAQTQQAPATLEQPAPKKQKIPPIVATLLLLAFAVGVGVVVMSFGRAQVELEATCPINIDMQFSEIGGVQQSCSDGNSFKFTVENGVNVNIEGLIVNVIGSDKAETFELNDAKMTKAGNYIGTVNFAGSIKQVKISPKILLKGEEQICPEKALIVESIGGC